MLVGAIDRVEKIDRQPIGDIGAAPVGGAARAAGMAAENPGKNVVPIEIGVAGAAGVGIVRMFGIVAVKMLRRLFVALRVDLAGVETLAAGLVAQNGVGAGEFLERLFGLLVAGVEVRMQLLGETAIGFLDLVLRSVFLDAENDVGVAAQNLLL